MHALASQSEDQNEAEVESSQPSPELLRALEQYPNLPSPPHIAAQIIELLKDPDADFKELMDSLAQDPALVAKILKTANSAMYARRREVTNMGQALLTLGQAATTTLALSFSLVGSLQDAEGPADSLNLDFFWRRSMLAGFAARSLGAALGSERREELFLAGLLQDIGLMVMGMALPTTYEVLVDRFDDHDAIISREIDLHGADHAWIGAWLLERWDLPKLICQAVRASHTSAVTGAEPKLHLPTEFESDPEADEFCACVALSGTIADVMLTNPNDATIAELALDMTGRLELEHEQILAVLDQIACQLPDIESQFGMSVLDADQTAEIVGRARTMLTDVSMKLLHQISDLQNRADTLVEEKSRDVLTGLYNREKLDAELASWVTRASKHSFPLALAFMDLDGFKGVNDVHGHPAGDAVLRSTAGLLSKQIRSSDTLARYGGDEFVLLLGGERKADALVVCQRILSAFEGTTHAIDGEVVDLHISIGLATLDMVEEATPGELVKAADAALLKAKALGKAQVICFDELDDK